LTDFSRLLARHASRRGLADHKWSITTSGGCEKSTFGGPNPPIWCVAALARCNHITLRTAPARMAGFDSIKGVNNQFLWYYDTVRQVVHDSHASLRLLNKHAQALQSSFINPLRHYDKS